MFLINFGCFLSYIFRSIFRLYRNKCLGIRAFDSSDQRIDIIFCIFQQISSGGISHRKVMLNKDFQRLQNENKDQGVPSYARPYLRSPCKNGRGERETIVFWKRESIIPHSSLHTKFPDAWIPHLMNYLFLKIWILSKFLKDIFLIKRYCNPKYFDKLIYFFFDKFPYFFLLFYKT